MGDNFIEVSLSGVWSRMKLLSQVEWVHCVQGGHITNERKIIPYLTAMFDKGQSRPRPGQPRPTTELSRKMLYVQVSSRHSALVVVDSQISLLCCVLSLAVQTRYLRVLGNSNLISNHVLLIHALRAAVLTESRSPGAGTSGDHGQSIPKCLARRSRNFAK